MSVAKAFVTGVVTKVPEKRFSSNNTAIAGFTINIDKNAETLLRVVSFGQLAETVSATISQGDSVAVEGRLQINSFKLPNGKDKRVYEIQASAVEKMSADASMSLPNQVSQAQNEQIVQFSQDEPASDLIDEDEIPF